MSRRSRRLARRRHTHNRNTRARRNQKRSPMQVTYSLYIPLSLRLAVGGWVNPYYAAAIARREHLQRELALADRMASLGFDMRDEHDAITTDVVTLERAKLHIRGPEISAEIDGVRICITEYGWCEREFGHDGPHVYKPCERS